MTVPVVPAELASW